MSEQPGNRAPKAVIKPAKDMGKALADHAPWKPVPASVEDLGALRALHRGGAEPHQQQRALKFIIDMCRTDGALYFPGENGRRDTDFALGRAWVGEQIVAMVNIRPKPSSENA